MRPYLQHGRRHAAAPGGSDPIPGFAGSSAWAMLSGSNFLVSGVPTATLPASATGVCIWENFEVGGDLDVFATHNTVGYPGYNGVPVPNVSAFNNSSGDIWVFAVKTGILNGYLDIGWNTVASFPLNVARNDGNSNYEGSETFGPRGWDDTGSLFSWSWLRPIDNDPSFYYNTPGDDFYYEFELQIRNNDSVDHAINADGIILALSWSPVVSGQYRQVY